MKWIQTGRQIGQAVKNVQRLRQIVSVLARHGYADVVERIQLGKYLPGIRKKTETDDKFNAAENLRRAFEELGPTFVKLGQLLSTRPDIIPQHFIDEFVKLQDDVATLPFETIKQVIEEELKGPIEDHFKVFHKEPLASASISQVHVAELHSGEKVVVKVQRPGIAKQISSDVAILDLCAKLLEQYVEELRVANPRVIVDEFFRTLSLELDFYVEANNIAKMAENLAEFEDIVLPKVYAEVSTSRILVLEKFEGIRFNNLKGLERAGIDKKKIVDIGARGFFKTVMIDGLFHGDLHGGNMFVLPGDKIGIIDFGIVGRLSQKSRDQLANMVASLVTEDFEKLCYQYADLGAADPSIDFESFQRELRFALSPYMGLSLGKVNTGRIFIEATKVATKYQIRVPGDWMIVFKAILTMEGMGRSLDPEFDMLEIGQELVKDLIKNQYSVDRLGKEVFWIGKDLLELLQVMPRQIRWMFQRFNRNDFALEIKISELKEYRESLEKNSRRLSLGIAAGAVLIAAALALSQTGGDTLLGYPAISVVFGAIGTVLLLRFLSI